MQAKLVLVVGGCRSGKSSFALRLVEALGGDRFFIATAPVLDAEMADRVRRHRDERHGRGWRTLEEEVDVAGALTASPPAAAVLVDCLTLWVNNVMYSRERLGEAPPEEGEIATLADDIIAAARRRVGATVFVANEVGLGIVPENAAARRFRDLAGRVNQRIAAAADEVHFMVCGLSTRIK